MNPETPKHTPTPWHIKRDRRMAFFQDDSKGSLGDAICARLDDETCAANAAFIVRAVNAHEALLEAAKIVSDGMNTAVDNDEHWTRQQMRAHLFAIQSAAVKAIAIAEGSRS